MLMQERRGIANNERGWGEGEEGADQIMSSSHQMVSHTRTVLTSAAAHKDNAVLLDVVACCRESELTPEFFFPLFERHWASGGRCIHGSSRNLATPPTPPPPRAFLLLLIPPFSSFDPSTLPPTSLSPNPKEYFFQRTYSLNISGNSPPTAEFNFGNLPHGRIRFFRLHRADFETHGFHLGTVHQRGGDGVAGASRHAWVAQDLHQGCGGGGSCGEEASAGFKVGEGEGEEG